MGESRFGRGRRNEQVGKGGRLKKRAMLDSVYGKCSSCGQNFHIVAGTGMCLTCSFDEISTINGD